MTMLPPSWLEWVEESKSIIEPTKLKDNTPEDVKINFEEWKKRLEKYRAMGYDI